MTTIRTAEFDLAWRFVNETRQNLFLTGKAGTGKTTFLRELRKHGHKAMVVAAPTGIAAINAGGVTLHSLFQLPLSPFVPARDDRGVLVNAAALLGRMRYNRSKLDLLRRMELLVIDEASMVAGHTLDAIDTILRSVRKRGSLPFGGVQVLFIGDLHQLQPVVKQDEWAILRAYYPSAFFFDAEVLRAHPLVKVELRQVFRQRDEQFIELLNQIRHNQLTEANLQLLNARLKPGFMPGAEEGYVTLTTHNAQADDQNRRRLHVLDRPSQMYEADIDGDFPESMYPADPVLELKEGAQVMFLRNDNEGKQYFNGKIGVVTRLGAEHVWVRCQGEENEIEVGVVEWPNTTYELHAESKELLESRKGAFRQLPLRLAWAITIHKSQGLTFDKVIIDAERAFANGQVYVALSRCTSLEGLVLTSPIGRRYLGAHEDLKQWQEKQVPDEQLPQELERSRQQFQQEELSQAFDLAAWRKGLSKLARQLTELGEDYLLQDWKPWLTQLNEMLTQTEEVARKFLAQMRDLLAAEANPEQNAALQDRIRAGANWFRQQAIKWLAAYQQVPFKVRTATEAQEVQENLEELNTLVETYTVAFHALRNGFVLEEFLKATQKAEVQRKAMPKVYEKARKAAITDGSSQPALMSRLKKWRIQQAEPGVPAFTIFSNATLEHICTVLPGNLEALMAVKGIGKTKANAFGEGLLSLVKEYCEENGLEVSLLAEKPKKEKKPKAKPETSTQDKDGLQSKVHTTEVTLEMHKAGKTVQEIAAVRGLRESTIESHLAKAISAGKLTAHELMDRETFHYIQSHISEGTGTLSELKAKMKEEIRYGQIKWVLAELGQGE